MAGCAPSGLEQFGPFLDFLAVPLYRGEQPRRSGQGTREGGEQLYVMAEFSAGVLGVRHAVLHRISEERVVVGLQRRSDTHLVSVRVRGERQQTCVLRGPAEPTDRSSS